jgi:hypothetical protein
LPKKGSDLFNENEKTPSRGIPNFNYKYGMITLNRLPEINDVTMVCIYIILIIFCLQHFYKLNNKLKSSKLLSNIKEETTVKPAASAGHKLKHIGVGVY